jgi:hypothetical protein
VVTLLFYYIFRPVNVGPDIPERDETAAMISKETRVRKIVKLSSLDVEHGLAIGARHEKGEAASVPGFWAGNLTTAGGETIHVNAQLAQGRASSDGSFGLAGAVTFDDVCFKLGTITPGTLPSASFIMGRSVVLDIKTDHGTLAFLGTCCAGSRQFQRDGLHDTLFSN